MITLHSIHRNLISLYQHRYIVKKNGVENFGKRSTRSNEKFKWHQSTNKKHATCKIISWVMDKRITIPSARISIYFLQNCKCVINIFAKEVGELHKGKRKALSLYTVKWKEPNWPQKPNWPQFLEGQFGPSRFVLDYLSQNGRDRYHFDPSKIWIGPYEFYFGTFSQFGPSKSQVGLTNLAPTRCNFWKKKKI